MCSSDCGAKDHCRRRRRRFIYHRRQVMVLRKALSRSALRTSDLFQNAGTPQVYEKRAAYSGRRRWSHVSRSATDGTVGDRDDEIAVSNDSYLLAPTSKNVRRRRGGRSSRSMLRDSIGSNVRGDRTRDTDPYYQFRIPPASRDQCRTRRAHRSFRRILCASRLMHS